MPLETESEYLDAARGLFPLWIQVLFVFLVPDKTALLLLLLCGAFALATKFDKIFSLVIFTLSRLVCQRAWGTSFLATLLLTGDAFSAKYPFEECGLVD